MRRLSIKIRNFSNYCTSYKYLLKNIRDYTRNYYTIHDRARDKEYYKEPFRKVVWRIYFDDYKLFRLSEYYEQPNGYNFHNEAVFIDYNKISTLGR